MQLPVVAESECLCARCARHQSTCCQFSEIYVTEGDVDRIASAVGSREFYEYATPVDPIYAQQDDDPIWREHVFREDGSRRVLKHQPDGDCTFLSATGCRLPLETRPLICRLYPFDYTADGLKDRPAGGCPVELLPPGADLLEVLDISRSDAQRWHRQLYDELQVSNLAAD
ncbi:MAG: hypothetical protein CMJ47_12255 [Planctomyces sp.]|nr:hypothetical protein [Planctomyces sp.]